MMKADTAGLQICTHAVGEEGRSTILDLYADSEREKRPSKISCGPVIG